MITKSYGTTAYFYINDENPPYYSTFKDARAILKVSKLCKFRWFRAYGEPPGMDTTVYGYLIYLEECSHGY